MYEKLHAFRNPALELATLQVLGTFNEKHDKTFVAQVNYFWFHF
jgi:hypothetical protein